MRIPTLTAIYECTLDEVERLVALHQLWCCEPAGEPFIAIRFSGSTEALVFKCAVPTATVKDEVAFISPDAWAVAEEALDRMMMMADRFDLLPVRVWDTSDKAVLDAAFRHWVI